MTPPLFPTQEALEWLAAAARDIRLAELALDDNPPLVGEALYHAQQAAEKALKAFLIANKVAYPLTHDIRKLLRMCEDVDGQLAAALLPAAGLTQFAARFRYPGEEQPTRDEAIPWAGLARAVRDEVARRLAADPAMKEPSWFCHLGMRNSGDELSRRVYNVGLGGAPLYGIRIAGAFSSWAPRRAGAAAGEYSSRFPLCDRAGC